MASYRPDGTIEPGGFFIDPLTQQLLDTQENRRNLMNPTREELEEAKAAMVPWRGHALSAVAETALKAVEAQLAAMEPEQWIPPERMEGMSDEPVDLSIAFSNPMDMPCCPLCGQPIETGDPYNVFIAHGCVLLAHTFCIAESREEHDL